MTKDRPDKNSWSLEGAPSIFEVYFKHLPECELTGHRVCVFESTVFTVPHKNKLVQK